jgi:zinc protease
MIKEQILNRTVPPAIVDATEFNLTLKPYEHFLLDNNVPVYAIDTDLQEVLQLEIVFYAGNFFEKNKSVAGATNFLLKNGTTTRTAFQLNEAFDYYGASCSRACYNETATITLHTLTKHADQLFHLVQDMLCHATFPQEELDTFKQNSQQRLKVNLQKAEFIAGRKIDQLLYGNDHPYGTFNNAEDYDSLTVEQLKDFYNQYYLNGTAVIFVAGKLPENIKTLLNENFGKLSIGKPKFILDKIKTTPAEQKKHLITNDANAVQGAIRIAQPFPNRHHADFKKVMVLNTIYGGFFGSRLMSNIREEKGYTYGIYSYIQNHIQESAWVISTEAGKDVCNATIEEVYKEMKIMREELIDEEELSLVRNYMIGGILGDLDGPFQIIAKWKNIVLNNLDENYFYESVQAIKTTTAEELQALAQKYLQPENFYELVVY